MITKKYGTPVEILYNFRTARTYNCIVDSPNTQVNSEGRKIVKAGTPLGADKRFPLHLNQTLHPKANPVGILHHDVDITNGPASGVVIVGGEIAFDNLEQDVKDIYNSNDQIFDALKLITFAGGANE